MAEELQAENQRLTQRIADIKADKFTYCAYCGEEFPIDAEGDVVGDHIQTCEKHPIAAYRARIAKLDADNQRMREALREAQDQAVEDTHDALDAQRATLQAENRRLREALREVRDRCLELEDGTWSAPVVGLIDDALADESTGILPSSYPAPPDKQPISTMVLGPGVENGSELARLKGRLDRAKPAEPSEEESDASR